MKIDFTLIALLLIFSISVIMVVDHFNDPKINMKEIESLTISDFPDKEFITIDSTGVWIPDATPENMVMLMKKINELTERINELTNGDSPIIQKYEKD